MTRTYTQHGLIKLQKDIRRRTRRGRSLIDKRSKAGKNAVNVRDQLLADMGGVENISAARLVLVEMISRDIYYLDECDRRIFKVIYKVNEDMKKAGVKGPRSPKLLGVMYGYRAGIARNLAQNLSLLGLDRKPDAETLEDYINEKYGDREQQGDSKTDADVQGEDDAEHND